MVITRTSFKKLAAMKFLSGIVFKTSKIILQVFMEKICKIFFHVSWRKNKRIRKQLCSFINVLWTYGSVSFISVIFFKNSGEADAFTLPLLGPTTVDVVLLWMQTQRPAYTLSDQIEKEDWIELKYEV